MLLKNADDRTVDIAMLRGFLDRGGLSQRQIHDIQTEIDNIRVGLSGESEVDHYLRHQFIDSRDVMVINDLRLEVDGLTAQIDHVLISRQREAYVLETKNLKAGLRCNQAGEWTAFYGPPGRGKPRPIASPIEQVRRHVGVLERWFRHYGVRIIDRLIPVVLVSSTTFVGRERPKGDEDVPVIRSDLFRKYWEGTRPKGLVSTLWRSATALSSDELQILGQGLVDSHRPHQWDWAARFGVLPLAPSGEIEDDDPGADNTSGRTPSAILPESEDPALHEFTEWPGEASAYAEPVNVEAPKPSVEVATPGHDAPPSPIDVGSSPAPGITPTIKVMVPTSIETPYGTVTIKRVTDGRYALRHAADKELRAHVESIARPRGQWQGRFKNWLVPADRMREVVGLLPLPGVNGTEG